MCPACMTAVALVAAGTTSGGVLGFVAVKFAWVRRLRNHLVSRPQ